MKGKEVGLGSCDGKFDTVYIKIKDWNEIQKKLKALEIIKEKFVIPAYITNTENVEEYNRQLKQITFRKDYEYRKLTKEEYNLLTEVLL